MSRRRAARGGRRPDSPARRPCAADLPAARPGGSFRGLTHLQRAAILRCRACHPPVRSVPNRRAPSSAVERLSLDQMRVFALAAELGSFTAAARALNRAQSAVSYALSALEEQIGLQLFDRSGYRPQLTPAGMALLDDAKVVLARADMLLARSQSIGRGVEAELSLSVEAMFPIAALAEVLGEFRSEFPTVTLRLYSETLGAVAQHVIGGTAMLGIVMINLLPAGLQSFQMPRVRMIPVAAPAHPLAAVGGTITRARIGDHVQLVLTDRSRLTEGRDYNVFSPVTWRLSDLSTKHALLVAGMGFGSMPDHMIEADLASGRLVPLAIDGFAPEGNALALSCVWREPDPGRAMQWMLDRLRGLRCYAPVHADGAPDPAAVERRAAALARAQPLS